eukprot:5268615-Pleurochrysis_carterae.AAC.1
MDMIFIRFWGNSRLCGSFVLRRLALWVPLRLYAACPMLSLRHASPLFREGLLLLPVAAWASPACRA